jgi:hypothetical protein
MGQISSNTWGIYNIVQCQLVDERAGLEEKGQWLERSRQFPVGVVDRV